MMKTDRIFLMYLVLSIVTCGIYPIIFWYQYTEDLNIICAKDGKPTMNYIIVLLLGIVTCGIFLFVWYYQIGDRLEKNCQAYGVQTTTSGTTLLLWVLLGTWVVVGPYIAAYKMIEDMNNLSIAYNNTMTGGQM